MIPNTTGGIAAIRPKAALAPYIGPVIAVNNSFMNTGIVTQSLVVRSRAMRKSLQFNMKTNRQVVANGALTAR